MRVEDLLTPANFIGVWRREGIVGGGGIEEVGDGFVELKVKLNVDGVKVEALGLSDIEHGSILVRFTGERDMSGLTFSASSFCPSNSSKEGVRRRFAEDFRPGEEVVTAIFALPDNGLGVLTMPVTFLGQPSSLPGPSIAISYTYMRWMTNSMTYHFDGS